MAWDWDQYVDLALQLYGSYQEGQGAKDAARAQTAGSNAAIAEQRRQFDLIFGMLQPQYQVGTQALNDLSRTFGYAPTNAMAQPSAVGGAAVAPSAATQGAAPAASGIYTRPVYDANGALMPVPAGIDERIAAAGDRYGAQGAQRRLSDEDRSYMQAYFDAYHNPSGVSQIAGTALNVAGMINPALGAGLAVANASHARAPTGFAGEAAPTGQTYQPATIGGTMNGAASGPTGLANFQASPDYEFRRNEGTRGISNSFAAGGGARSGNALRALADFNSGLASQEFTNYFNRRAALAGIGQTATNQASSLAQNTGNAIGNFMQNGANARASGIVGQTNALTGGISDVLSWWNRNRQPMPEGGGWI